MARHWSVGDFDSPWTCTVDMDLLERLLFLECWYQGEDAVVGFSHNFVALALVARFHVFFDLAENSFPIEILGYGVDGLSDSGMS